MFLKNTYFLISLLLLFAGGLVFTLGGKVLAHSANQPPFFKINGVFNDYNPVQTFSQIIDIPLDYFDQNFLVGQRLEMEIVKDLIPEKQEKIENLNFVWNFGDGKVYNGLKTSHVYQKPGIYPLTIRVVYPDKKEFVAVRADLVILPEKNYDLPKVRIEELREGENIILKAATAGGIISRVVWDIDNQKREGLEQQINITNSYGMQVVARGFDENGFFSDVVNYVNNQESVNWAGTETSNKNSLIERVFDLFRQPQDNWWLVGAVGIVYAAGAVHALTPGHGKSILSAYVAGRSGTRFYDLLLIALSLTVTHTAVIFGLGFALLIVDSRLEIESLSGAIQRVGALVVLYLAYRMYRGAKNSNGGIHDHGFGPHSHTHTSPNIQSKKDVVLAGISGGVIPCLDAFSIMILAASSGRVVLGLLLVLIFSLGLASMVLLLGLLLLGGKGVLFKSERVTGIVSKWGTYAASVFIAVAAVVMFVRA